MNEPNLKGLDSHSEEMQDLIGAVPPWIQRWGVILVGAILVGALAVGASVRLPERYSVELRLLSAVSQGIVEMPVTGTISGIRVADGAEVAIGDTLLTLEGGEVVAAPAKGRVDYIGPVRENIRIDVGAELLRINGAADCDSMLLWGGHVTQQVAEALSGKCEIDCGELGRARVLFVARAPDSSGRYYIELAVAASNGLQPASPVTVSITLTSETLLSRLLAGIRQRSSVSLPLEQGFGEGSKRGCANEC